MPNGFQMPSQLPTFQFAQPVPVSGGGALQFSPEQILGLIQQSGGQSLVNLALPAMEQILGQQGRFIAPQIEAIRGRGEELAAQAQSEATARGLTGSDIEAAGILGARQGAAQQEAQFRGQVGMQQAMTLAQSLFQAMGLDIGANREMFQNLAMAIGQELTARREREMFQLMLQEGIAEAGRQHLARQQAPFIQAGAQVGTSLLKGGLGKAGLPLG